MSSYYEKFPDGKVVCVDEEIPFEIPEGWEWCRLGNVAEIIGGYAFPSQTIKGNVGTRVIRISDITEEGFSDTRLVRYSGGPISEIYQINQFDILIAMTGGTVGKSLFVMELPEKMLLNQRVAIIRSRHLCAGYINLVIKAPHIIAVINDRKNSTNDNISMVDIYNFLIPIPPLSEQNDIVAKYQEVRPLAERYEKAQLNADALNACLSGKLKSSILQEAIQGKLVPQDSSDEPAEKLLEKINTEKLRLVKEGKLKAKDAVSSVIFKGDDNKYYEQIGNRTTDISEEIPFEIPDSWAWTRLGNLVSNNAGLAYSKGDLDKKSSNPIRVLRGGNISDGSWAVKDDDVMIAPEFVNPKLLLRKGTFITPAVTSLERMGKTALISANLDDTVVGGFVLMLIPYHHNDTMLQYLLDFFQTIYYKQYCTSITNKSGQAFYNISRAKLMGCMVPIPPFQEQQRIALKIAEIQELIQ